MFNGNRWNSHVSIFNHLVKREFHIHAHFMALILKFILSIKGAYLLLPEDELELLDPPEELPTELERPEEPLLL